MSLGAIGAAIGAKAGNTFIDNLVNLPFTSSANSKAKRAEQRNYAFQREMQKNQLKWEKEKFETAYQTAVKDLKKAGLNPVLAAMNGGNSAGSISGGSGTDVAGNVASQQATNISNGIINSVKQQMELKRLKEIQRLNNSVIDKNNADTILTNLNSKARETLNEYLPKSETKRLAQLDAETLKKQAEIRNIQLNNELQLNTNNEKIIQESMKAQEAMARGKSANISMRTLQNFGLTREEFVQLGTEGVRSLVNLLTLGVGGKNLQYIAKTFAKNSKMHNSSAKRKPKISTF